MQIIFNEIVLFPEVFIKKPPKTTKETPKQKGF